MEHHQSSDEYEDGYPKVEVGQNGVNQRTLRFHWARVYRSGE
jgi:hypothetical protein